MPNSETEISSDRFRLSAETLKGKDFLKQIRTKDGEPDPRFLPIDYDERGAFHFSPLDPLSDAKDEGIYYSLLKRDDRIIGIAQMQDSPHKKDVLWFKSISIDKDLKGQGYSEQLLREIFRFAKSKNARLWISRPTKEGKERVRYKLRGLSQEFGVQIFNSNGEPFTE